MTKKIAWLSRYKIPRRKPLAMKPKHSTPNREQEEKKLLTPFEVIWENYWWNIRNFSYRVNNSGENEREMLALAIEPYLKQQIEDTK